MAKLKKNTARLILKGMSILGMLLAFYFFLCAIFIIASLGRDPLVVQCSMLVFSGTVLVLGTYLMYSSYLMFRGRAFGALKPICGSFLFVLFSEVRSLVIFLSTTSVSGKEARSIEDRISFILLLLFLLAYAICVKLSKRFLDGGKWGSREN